MQQIIKIKLETGVAVTGGHIDFQRINLTVVIVAAFIGRTVGLLNHARYLDFIGISVTSVL